ncbi:MAG: DUF1854 domain-containing protein [Myxococcota bacterium]
MQPDIETAAVSSRRGNPSAVLRAKSASAPGFRLERRVDGKLWLSREENWVAVEVVRCFPWTQPDRFLSLRDSDGTEHGFVAAVRDLDAESQRALQQGLLRSGFVLEVTRVLEVEEDFELRSFAVETVQGPRRFQTALDAWPRELDGGGLVIEDVYGDLYRISAPHKLDEKSLELMRAFID